VHERDLAARAGEVRPGPSEPVSAVVCQLVDEAGAYCTVQPARSTAVVPRLSSSTKSFV
jgi:hypothetical protein